MNVRNGNFRFILKIVPVVLFFGCLFFVHSLFAQDQKDKLQQTKKQLEEEIRYTNSLLEQTKKSKKVSLNKVQLLTRQIKQREHLLQEINSEIDQLDDQIGNNRETLSRLNGELIDLKKEYGELIRYTYKNMNSYNQLAFVFAASDFRQAYHRLKYFQQYSEYRKKQANRIVSTKKQIDLKTRDLENQKNQKEQLAGTQEKEKSRLNKEKEEKNQVVKDLSKKEKQLLATLKDKEKAADRLQREIQKMIAEEIRVANEKAAKAGKSETKSETGKPAEKTSEKEMVLLLTPEETQLSNSFAMNKGKLPWPSEKGVVSSSFGEHPHPVLKFVKTKNNGIDILTEKGAEARAVFTGKVTRVMSFPNMNKVVIIRHGEYLTVYSNLSDVYVKDGDMVKTKQKIGRVQTSDTENKTELHFELWKGKATQNPSLWLAGYKN